MQSSLREFLLRQQTFLPSKIHIIHEFFFYFFSTLVYYSERARGNAILYLCILQEYFTYFKSVILVESWIFLNYKYNLVINIIK